MSGPRKFTHRVNAVETQLTPKCPACQERPIREVTIDGDTDELLSESIPADGCPLCGHQPLRELRLVVESGDA